MKNRVGFVVLSILGLCVNDKIDMVAVVAEFAKKRSNSLFRGKMFKCKDCGQIFNSALVDLMSLIDWFDSNKESDPGLLLGETNESLCV